MVTNSISKEKFRKVLLDFGILASELRSAEESAAARGIELEKILIGEYGVPRRVILHALSEYYNCPFIEYDERMPIPREILQDLDSERLSISQWFPVIKDGGTVIIAANNPEDSTVREEVRRFIKAGRYEFWAALGEDIQRFIQDFLHAKPGALIGTERTGLAFWRNTMAYWRTRLACYRNDLAKGRTDLALLRWGLGFVAISDTLMRAHKIAAPSYFYPVRKIGLGILSNGVYWAIICIGFFLAIFGLSGYLKIRKSRLSPPMHHTLVEVTAATLNFLEDYHFIDNTGVNPQTKKTMLARLGDFLSDHCTILYPSPSSKERTHLARERNVLAAQRTIAACYRTIYSRARTGLAFIRTGIAFSSLGFGLMHYFGLSLLTILDSVLVAAGVLMVVDGMLWYMPVRKEQSELPRCPVPQ